MDSPKKDARGAGSQGHIVVDCGIRGCDSRGESEHIHFAGSRKNTSHGHSGSKRDERLIRQIRQELAAEGLDMPSDALAAILHTIKKNKKALDFLARI